MHYTSSVHNTAFVKVLGYVQLCSSSTDTSYQKRSYADLCKVFIHSETCLRCPVHREGGNKRLYVRPSVCLSITYITNNSRTQRPSVPKFGRTVPHLRCDSHTSFTVKMAKVRATRPINADTHCVPYPFGRRIHSE